MADEVINTACVEASGNPGQSIVRAWNIAASGRPTDARRPTWDRGAAGARQRKSWRPQQNSIATVGRI
jgi:hypothetical protein